MRTTGKQCGLAATGVYQPSLRSPWLAAIAGQVLNSGCVPLFEPESPDNITGKQQ
ncbi:hypothetical protein [Thiolapillus sp.]|uniref:hypothetical protein n=1 Tax=Thiolapillus sp. TaxID=2017437 RepID=UPI0025F6184C|nr:hypothetical protein [Thiolapillus sp.]